ncbi:unnamed protein product [Rangifer tarandus platyrhynchus]|uniref:Uncharacterized protein n=1 Tax=Rangifer tarandus platyrhynchus TaxID=3082113 RepID=A0ABN8ZW78_RANTA|nr:unnamed protein product [Rangifer tarandus platyrhynchus]
MVLFSEKGAGAPISPPARAAGPADVGFPSLLRNSARPSCYIASTGVVADLWPGPPPGPSVDAETPLGHAVSVALAPRTLAAGTVGGDARRAAPTLGSPHGNSRLLQSSRQAGCLPGRPAQHLPAQGALHVGSWSFAFAFSEVSVGVGIRVHLVQAWKSHPRAGTIQRAETTSSWRSSL